MVDWTLGRHFSHMITMTASTSHCNLINVLLKKLKVVCIKELQIQINLLIFKTVELNVI